MQTEIARLNKQIEEMKPGLGEIMGVIQQHHAKLYYSGMSENWDLANYQLGEIQEGLDDAMKYYPRFKEVKTPLTELVPTMTKASLAGLEEAIGHRNKVEFSKAFRGLSTSCTHCHQAADHPFIVIQEPASGMFSNQRFTKATH